MATKIIGKARCAECDAVQAVKNDGHKHFMQCEDCGTMVQFQPKKAQSRIENRMVDKDIPDNKLPNHVQPLKSSWLDSCADWF